MLNNLTETNLQPQNSNDYIPSMNSTEASQDKYAISPMEEEYNPEGVKKVKWSNFAEVDAANFFTGFKLEKMTIEDGNGNKARLAKTKDGGIKIEYTSTITI